MKTMMDDGLEEIGIMSGQVKTDQSKTVIRRHLCRSLTMFPICGITPCRCSVTYDEVRGT